MKYVVYGKAVISVEKEIEAESMEEALRLAGENTDIEISIDGQPQSSDCVTDLEFVVAEPAK